MAFGTLRNGSSTFSDLSFFTGFLASTTVDAGATLDVNDNSMTVQQLLGAGSVTLGASAATNLTVSSGNFSGAISGAGNFIKNNPGTFEFSGSTPTTYTGTTTVKDGNLILNRTIINQTIVGNIVIGDGIGAANSALVTLGHNGQIANTSNMTINIDGRFDMAGLGEAMHDLTIIDGNVVNVPTDGINDLGVSGNLNMTGGSISGGTGATNGLSLFGGATSVTATSDATGAATINSNVSMGTQSRTFTVNPGPAPAGTDLVINGVVQQGVADGSVAITKAGTGVMQLAGINTYTGITAVNGGELIASQSTVGSNSSLGFGTNTAANGTVVNTGGKLTLSNGTSITNEFLTLNNGGQLNGNVGTATWGGTILVTGTPGKIAASFSTLNVGNIIKDDTSTQTFSGNNAYIGGTTVNGGTHDQLKTTGTANITGGTLALVRLNGYLLQIGD